MGCGGCNRAKRKLQRLKRAQVNKQAESKPEPSLSPRAAKIKARAERIAGRNSRIIARKARLAAREAAAKEANSNG